MIRGPHKHCYQGNTQYKCIPYIYFTVVTHPFINDNDMFLTWEILGKICVNVLKMKCVIRTNAT